MNFSTFRLFSNSPNGSEEHVLRFLGFPGGERHVWLPSTVTNSVAQLTIDARIYSAEGVMDLLMLNDALRRVVGDRAVIKLMLPYLPYARQDRVTCVGEPLSVKVFCNLINSMKFDEVMLADPHSSVGPALLDRVVVESADVYVKQVVALPEFAGGVALVAPDAGAHKRVQQMGESLKVPVVLCGKSRDTLSGRLSQATLIGDRADIPKLPLLVVDDICDGGGTFTALAALLRGLVDSPLSLYVTHGLYTKGLAPLNQYDGLYTAYPRDPSMWERRDQLDIYQVSAASRQHPQ